MHLDVFKLNSNNPFMEKQPKFIFDPVASEENFESALFWDSPAVISQLREELKKIKKRNGK